MNAPRREGARGPARYFYVVTAEPTETASGRHAVLDGHLAWLANLESNGTLFLAGPFVGEDRQSTGGGMFILRAESLAAAEACVRDDPYVANGFRRAQVRPWRVDQGRFDLAVSLTGGTHGFQ